MKKIMLLVLVCFLVNLAIAEDFAAGKKYPAQIFISIAERPSPTVMVAWGPQSLPLADLHALPKAAERSGRWDKTSSKNPGITHVLRANRTNILWLAESMKVSGIQESQLTKLPAGTRIWVPFGRPAEAVISKSKGILSRQPQIKQAKVATSQSSVKSEIKTAPRTAINASVSPAQTVPPDKGFVASLKDLDARLVGVGVSAFLIIVLWAFLFAPKKKPEPEKAVVKNEPSKSPLDYGLEPPMSKRFEHGGKEFWMDPVDFCPDREKPNGNWCVYVRCRGCTVSGEMKAHNFLRHLHQDHPVEALSTKPDAMVAEAELKDFVKAAQA